MIAVVGFAVWPAATGRRGRRLRLVSVSFAAIGLAGGLVGGYFEQRRFHDSRYKDFDPVIAWVQEQAPEGNRIGIARRWPYTFYSPPLAMYGPRFGNQVAFVGPVRDGILGQYSRASEFQRAVERGRFDLVLLQNATGPGATREERWLRPLGFSRVAKSDILVLVRRPAVGS